MTYLSKSKVLNNHQDPKNDDSDKNSTDSLNNHHPTPLSTELNDWSNSTVEVIDALPRVWTRGLLYMLAAFTGILLPWVMFSKVDETGSARGRLEPKGKTIELDAPVAGKVAAMKVKEGEKVLAGQVLVEFESELVKNELQQLQSKLQGQQQHLAQLELLKNQLLLALRTQEEQNQARSREKQTQIEKARHNLESLRATYNLKKEEAQARVQQARQGIESSNTAYELATIRWENAEEKVPRYKKAFEDGAISKERYLEVVQMAKESKNNLVKAESEIRLAESRLKEQQGNYDNIIHQTSSEIQQGQLRLQEEQSSYQSLIHSGELALLKSKEQLKNVETQFTTLKAEMSQSQSKISSLKYQLGQRVMRAPIDGTIFQLPIGDAGTVVQPGELIAKIAPKDSEVVLKAKMPSSETGFLQLGMPVKIKFDAYPFGDYGVVEGRLKWVSPDSTVQETSQGQIETFDIEVTLDRPYIESPTGQMTLTPGQTATAEVIVRQRRVIDFVLDPFKKLQEGGLEL